MKTGRKAAKPIQPDNELRGFKVRLYPDQETVRQMKATQEALRKVWNWIVRGGEDESHANEAWAVREGLIEPKPRRPDYDGMSSEESKQAAEQHRNSVRDWYARLKPVVEKCPKRGLFAATLKNGYAESWLDAYGVRWDYQMMRKVLAWAKLDEFSGYRINTVVLQALSHDFFKSKGYKRFKRACDRMPIRSRTGDCFALGKFGSRGSTHRNAWLPNPDFYNCQIMINGWKIKGRLPGKLPGGRILQGVSLVEEADGWYASVKVEVPKRVLPQAVPGSVIGLDVGLDNLVAFSEPVEVSPGCKADIVQSTRGLRLSRQIAELQQNDRPTGRLHQKASRHNLHEILNKIIKPLGKYEIIKVENLSSKIGQMGSRKQSSMLTILNLLKQRYGERVQEVSPAYTSQTCSQCKLRDKKAWEYDDLSNFKACKCGFSCHRDVNAARNVAVA